MPPRSANGHRRQRSRTGGGGKWLESNVMVWTPNGVIAFQPSDMRTEAQFAVEIVVL
jgi:hypothetical protein